MERLEPTGNQEEDIERVPNEYTLTHRLEDEKYVFELNLNKTLKKKEKILWYNAWRDALDKIVEKYQLSFSGKGDGTYETFEFQIKANEITNIEQFCQELEIKAIDIFTSPRKPHLF